MVLLFPISTRFKPFLIIPSAILCPASGLIGLSNTMSQSETQLLSRSPGSTDEEEGRTKFPYP